MAHALYIYKHNVTSFGGFYGALSASEASIVGIEINEEAELFFRLWPFPWTQ
jgi:hypothetical protein